MNKIALATRTFQPRKSLINYDSKKLIDTFIKPLLNLTKRNKFDKIYIIINAEEFHPYAEITENGVCIYIT